MENLLQDFRPISSKEWKQKMQVELNGLDYNDTLVWESLEGIKVKPFYHIDQDFKPSHAPNISTDFAIKETIFVADVQKSNLNAHHKLQRGAQIIQFIIDPKNIDLLALMQGLDSNKIWVSFTEISFVAIEKLIALAENQKWHVSFLIDVMSPFMTNGNWVMNQNDDFLFTKKISTHQLGTLMVDNTLLQNAGANIIQQLAYTVLHWNTYLENRIFAKHTILNVAIGGNYFFEIAKLKALRILAQSLSDLYEVPLPYQIVATPSKRNKTIYDYNVNMLRTTTECMSGILGGADVLENMPYDGLYHKNNDFGDRIARNQLLIIREEAYLSQNKNAVEGSYYLEALISEMVEKSLQLIKHIDNNKGFISQLFEGAIQRKIKESAQKEQALLDHGDEVLLGTTKYANPNDLMKNDLQLYPFVKRNTRKTLITPIIPVRLAEAHEQKRLQDE